MQLHSLYINKHFKLGVARSLLQEMKPPQYHLGTCQQECMQADLENPHKIKNMPVRKLKQTRYGTPANLLWHLHESQIVICVWVRLEPHQS